MARIAYADPPYIGQAKKHYQSEEVDHAALLKQLQQYDGWALSASSPSLSYLLSIAPDGVRVASWVKPFSAFKVGVNPAYTWEPVLFCPARKWARDAPTIKDHVIESITLKKGLSGAKPVRFCLWLFRLLGAEPGDTFDDLFPGTGIVSSAWRSYCECWPNSINPKWEPDHDLWDENVLKGDDYVPADVRGVLYGKGESSDA